MGLVILILITLTRMQRSIFAALADKLGSSPTDIHLSVETSQASADAAEQDYNLKAENAFDYEDIDERYEGPEVQALTEEDNPLPKSDYVSTTVPPVAPSSLFDDENYDEDEEEEELQKELDRVDNIDQVDQAQSASLPVLSQGKFSPEDGSCPALEIENSDPDVVELQKEDTDMLEEPLEAETSTLSPILCVEDGNVILRFSEIFAIHEPLKKTVKREQWFSVPKEKYKSMEVSDIVEEDEEAFLKGSLESFPYMRHAHGFQDDFLTLQEGKLDLPKSGSVDEDGTVASKVDDQRKEYCHDVIPSRNKLFSDDYFPLNQSTRLGK